MRKKLIVLLLLPVILSLLGASCRDSGSIPPPIPAQTDLQIYQTFYQVEAKYKALKTLVDEFSKLAAQTTNFACDANIQSVCDAGSRYAVFLDTKLVPASERAGNAYKSAVAVYQDYRKGSADEATFQDKLSALQKMIDDLQALFDQGKGVFTNG